MLETKKPTVYQLLVHPATFLTAILLLNLYTAFQTGMGNDEGIWCYIANLWNHFGIPPYTMAVENKTPGIFYLFTLGCKFFGVNFWFPRLLAVISIGISGWFLYLSGKLLLDRNAGLLAMLIFGLAMAWGVMDGLYTAQTETFMALFTILAFFYFFKFYKNEKTSYISLLWAGIWIGAAIAFKQIAITSLVVLFIGVLITKKNDYQRLRGVAFLVAGVLAATVVSILPLLFTGVSIIQYIHGAWLTLLKSGSSLSSDNRVLYFLGAWSRPGLSPLYPLAALVLFNSKKLRGKGIPWLVFVLWILFDFIAVNSSGFYYGHQFKQLLPSIALGGGLVLSTLFGTNERHLPHAQLLVVILLLFIPPGAYTDRPDESKATLQKNYKELGLWLKDHTKPEQPIYIYTEKANSVMAWSERKSSSRYFNAIFIVNDKGKEASKLLKDLENNPPAFFLVDHGKRLPNPVHKWVLDNTKLVTDRDGFVILKPIDKPKN